MASVLSPRKTQKRDLPNQCALGFVCLDWLVGGAGRRSSGTSELQVLGFLGLSSQLIPQTYRGCKH